MTNHNEQISSIHTDNSVQRIFLESQLNAVQKQRKTVRWHPAIIKWCIFLCNKSSSAYKTLRSSCISLPSQRTLKDYTHFYKSSSGFLDSQLIRESKISLLDHQMEVRIVLAQCFYLLQVSLVADEMHIKEGHVYKFTGTCMHD